MNGIPRIKTLMTPFPHAIDAGASLERAIDMMAEHDIRHLPVTDGADLVGVLSDRDVRLSLDAGGAGRRSVTLRVRDACVHDPYVVDLNEPADKVLLEMAERHLGSALVVREETLIGIFTSTDACREFGVLLQRLFPQGGDDAA